MEFVLVAVEVVLQIAADMFAVVCNWVGFVEMVKMDDEIADAFVLVVVASFTPYQRDTIHFQFNVSIYYNATFYCE